MEQAKFAVEVVAGLLPGQPEPEFTKRFWATSREWQSATDPVALLDDRWSKGVEYAKSILNPNRVNWVRVDWVWF